MGNGASVENGNGEAAGEKKSGGFMSGMMAGASALASGALAAGAEAADAAANALDSGYVVDAKPVRQITVSECQYFECMNAISRITYQDPDKSWDIELKVKPDDQSESEFEDKKNAAKSASLKKSLDDYCDGNYPKKELSVIAKAAFTTETKASLKVHEVDTTRAITGVFELPHKSWTGRKKCFVVAFRGTKLQDEHGNWQFADAIHDLASTFLTEFKDSNDGVIGSAGMGFVTAYDKLRRDSDGKINGFLDEIVAGAAACPGGLIITGHSLGGALATLCAVDLLYSKNISPKLITFGAPRAFKPNLAATVSARTDFENCRIVNHGDPIPLLPPSIVGMYKHCGNPYFFKVPLPPRNEEEEAANNETYKENHDDLLALAVIAKASGFMKSTADKSNGEWCEMDHQDFHGEFPDVMKALVEEIQSDMGNMISILTRVLLEIDITCHDLGGYGLHLMGFMDKAVKE